MHIENPYLFSRYENALQKINTMLVVNHRTGEIKKSARPSYKGKTLSDVYTRYSKAKEQAYKNCEKILSEIGWEFVTSYGITSSNTFSFTFEAVIELENFYVLHFTSCRGNISYYGDKYNSCIMNEYAYLLEG